MTDKSFIAARSKEFKNGDIVNLGSGCLIVPNFLQKSE